MRRFQRRRITGMLTFAAAGIASAAAFAVLPLPSAEECAVTAVRLVAGADRETTAVTVTEKPSETAEISDFMPISYGKITRPSSANEEAEVHSEEPVPASPDIPENGSGKIERKHYGEFFGDEYISLPKGGQIRNITEVSNDEVISAAENGADFTLKADGKIRVMIMHTHTTECYEPEPSDSYDSERSCRTTELSANMAAVGDRIAAELEKAGIGVYHDVTLHDYPSYNGSYERSAETVKAALTEYPDIQIVLDVHRDAMETADGVRLAPVADIDGKTAAQVMIICGADDGTMDMPNFMKNLGFAADLQQALEETAPTLTRPVLFDYRRYNQDLTTGSLLIEVGSHGNSLDEALYSGELIGKALAAMASEE
ncbi:MAG: stage II sporulation protein P [Oscillospiraceae bacterium]|nr:stage II sporulation protein P [Oscillospiraceae bacterium]